MEKGKSMKINAIGVTTFGNKQQVAKKAALFAGAGILGAAVGKDSFVKGISKPSAKIEETSEDIIRANDGDLNRDDCCFDCSSCEDDDC